MLTNMLTNIILISAVLTIGTAFFPIKITGITPPPVACPNTLCNGKYDGNFDYINSHDYKINPHYFLQCSNGKASCQACWPVSLVFKQSCNQCLYSEHDDCVTTKEWHPETTFSCPDICPHKGPHFSGNINDPNNNEHYVACWKGITVGCITCPIAHTGRRLQFNKRWNACLYGGKFKIIPPRKKNSDYPPYGK